MPVGRRYKVKCGICGSTFNNDYTSKHCRTSHPSYNVTTLPTTVCRESNQSTLSTLFVSRVQEQAKSPSRSPPNDTQSDQSSDEEHQPEALIEFEEALFRRETCENDPQSEIEQQHEMTSDEEMVDKPSPEQQRNVNRDDQVDKITSESSDSSDSSTGHRYCN